MLVIFCDRCGEVIPPRAGLESEDRQRTITLNMGEEFYTWQLHHRCADQFRADFDAWVKRAQVNPPTPGGTS
jgi:hypothetical protein